MWVWWEMEIMIDYRVEGISTYFDLCHLVMEEKMEGRYLEGEEKVA